MSIRLFEDIEAWQLGRQLTKNIYGLTKNALFQKTLAIKIRFNVPPDLQCTISRKDMIPNPMLNSYVFCDTQNDRAAKFKASFI